MAFGLLKLESGVGCTSLPRGSLFMLELSDLTSSERRAGDRESLSRNNLQKNL